MRDLTTLGGPSLQPWRDLDVFFYLLLPQAASQG
jgi:hypothetical protein